MKIYFERTNGNNLVIVAEGRNAKIYDGAPSGIYAGVDLYAEDAADQLRARFQELDEAGELNGFSEMGGEEIKIGHDLFEELAEAELVFSQGGRHPDLERPGCGGLRRRYFLWKPGRVPGVLPGKRLCYRRGMADSPDQRGR